MNEHTIFLLSPAHCGGRRAATLFRPGAEFDLAARVRAREGAPLGEVFSYLSGLYFRGKMAYASRFARPPEGAPGALVITSGRGLLPPSTHVTLEDLAEFAKVAVDAGNPLYAEPVLADLAAIASELPERCRVVLLGSIATAKYVELLLSVVGDRLCFPEAFVGVGDMSRGAILLRSAAAGVELPYLRAAGATRSLARPRGIAR
jgi:hypothetical protein